MTTPLLNQKKGERCGPAGWFGLRLLSPVESLDGVTVSSRRDDWLRETRGDDDPR